MGIYHAKLKNSRQVAEGTIAVYFDKPEVFEFVGGQSIDLTLLNPPETDAKGNTRAFSLASAPGETDLMIATRQRDTSFKRVLRQLPAGTEVKIEGPFGSMTLHRKTVRPAVILAGGIGITPFRSMVRQALKDGTGHRLILFYSNRRPQDAAFLSELQELARLHSNFTLVATVTKLEDPGCAWNGETGYIDGPMLKRFVGGLVDPVYYIAGPPAMVAAMKGMLHESGVDEDDVNTEDFAGY